VAAEPAREQLLAYLETTLQRMNSGRGFFYDWKGCQRWVLQPPSNAGWPYSSLIDTREVVTEHTQNRLHRALDIAVGGWHVVTQGREDGPAQAAIRMASDIERALMWDRRQGRNAVDTILTGSEIMVDASTKPSVFVEVSARVTYRTNIEEPTEAL
jgi:hypothetical protein